MKNSNRLEIKPQKGLLLGNFSFVEYEIRRE